MKRCPDPRPGLMAADRVRAGARLAALGMLVVLVWAASGASAGREGSGDAARQLERLPQTEVVLHDAGGELTRITVRVATTAGAHARGLSGVADVEPHGGLLFLFEDEEDHGGFWMKGALVPLDVVFLAADPDRSRAGQDSGAAIVTRVLAVVPMTVCDADAPCPTHYAPGPYLAALEVPAGTLPTLEPGSRVTFTRP
jgi:uncharacterized membrane protein (UPF0127 family)